MHFLSSLLDPETKQPLVLQADGNSLQAADGGTTYPVLDNGIVDLVFPRELKEEDAREQHLYDQAYQRYDRGVSWVFETLNHSNEAATREFMIGLMNLKPGQTVLEVGAGTGKDSALILKGISPGGHAVLSDLSPNMLRLAKEKLQADDVQVDYFLGNGSYLPFPDATFDALFHFGGINTFSERRQAFAEMTRVVKPGGKVVIGDESIAPWLRNEPSYQMLLKANPLFRAEVPLEDVPPSAVDFNLHWIFGNAFYVMEYTVSARVPVVDVDWPMPGKDFLDNWRIRAEKAND
jgi:ubiquinone/menaquinone biosynthesis C-methylase UbiE